MATRAGGQLTDSSRCSPSPLERAPGWSPPGRTVPCASRWTLVTAGVVAVLLVLAAARAGTAALHRFDARKQVLLDVGLDATPEDVVADAYAGDLAPARSVGTRSSRSASTSASSPASAEAPPVSVPPRPHPPRRPRVPVHHPFRARRPRPDAVTSPSSRATRASPTYGPRSPSGAGARRGTSQKPPTDTRRPVASSSTPTTRAPRPFAPRRAPPSRWDVTPA